MRGWLTIAGSVNSVEPAKYLPELAKTDGFQGVTAKIAFDEKGDIKDGAITLYQAKGGKWEPQATLGGSPIDAISPERAQNAASIRPGIDRARNAGFTRQWPRADRELPAESGLPTATFAEWFGAT